MASTAAAESSPSTMETRRPRHAALHTASVARDALALESCGDDPVAEHIVSLGEVHLGAVRGVVALREPVGDGVGDGDLEFARPMGATRLRHALRHGWNPNPQQRRHNANGAALVRNAFRRGDCAPRE